MGDLEREVLTRAAAILMTRTKGRMGAGRRYRRMITAMAVYPIDPAIAEALGIEQPTDDDGQAIPSEPMADPAIWIEAAA
jgi:hypothetical protein